MLAWKQTKDPEWPDLCVHPLRQLFWDWLINSFIFCLQLSGHKYSKLAESNFFEKSLAFVKTVQNAPNDQIICSSIMAAFFLRIGSSDLSLAQSWGDISTQNWKRANLRLNSNINENKSFLSTESNEAIMEQWPSD